MSVYKKSVQQVQAFVNIRKKRRGINVVGLFFFKAVVANNVSWSVFAAC